MTENKFIKNIFDIILPIVDEAKRRGVQFSDIRAMSGRGSSILVQDSKAEKVFYSQSSGVAVRVLYGGAWGFASMDGWEPGAIFNCLEEAIALAKGSAKYVTDPAIVAGFDPVQLQICALGKLDPDEIPLAKKQAICLDQEKMALASGGGKIVNSVVSYGDGLREQWIVNTVGTQAYSKISRSRVSCQVTAMEGDMRQSNYQGLGHQGGPEILLEINPEEFSVKAAKKVLQQLKSKQAPAGEFPVIFHPTISGLLAHEALGHNAEADAIWSGQSILQGKMGQQVASPLVTIVDDATLAGKYGSEPFDSEGIPTRRRVVLKHGVLNELLHSLETAGKFKTASNGCGRAQDYGSMPQVRMSNTFFEPGTSSVDEMIKGIDRGIYLREGHDGYVFTERGQFVCHASEAQMIEHGNLGEPLRDVSVSGLILETLMNIDRVGSDFEMIFPGTCGKGGQGVPTDCGGPHLRVSRMVVGGVGE
ncbi:MAG: TldD/PmbA family protein [Phycisphaerae bacterium]